MTSTTKAAPRYKGKRNRLDRPELLAPAGNLEKLKFAVHYGADAVYIGGQKYGLRSNAGNFSFEEMKEGVEFANRYGAKVFVATNIYAHNEDVSGLEDYLRNLEEAGIAAIIAADPVIIETAQRVAPKLEVHLSTQQSTMNWQAVQFWKEEGLPRVVLARETSFADIAEIKKHVDIEIEAFIHGAMCSSYSGRCVLSNHFTDRDSNRGGCCQSCRWKYDLFVDDAPMYEQGEDQFTMGSKDLCMIDYLPELIEVGVDSFKIEGRMKSIHYVATVVNVYRQAIDAYFADPEHFETKQEWIDEMNKAANRPLNTGFFLDTPGAEDHIYEPEEKAAPYDFAGIVLEYNEKTGFALLQQRNHFKVGQEVEFVGPGGTFFKQTVTELTNAEGQPLDAAKHPMEHVRIRTLKPVKAMDMMRKRIR
ncbi:U32 family peptidase [Paenibacillus sp. GSMTC-2017]|uniref:peptidase U32 family protein n=1 Tax=Paenibacillus sp. GSMTC-2017 TaxID=2794350 RepID=UPI0018D86385|nr:U32 family peptidase [Paenibacillus sp. GSMTC-2017]MBH5317077.1 U32 family peptidase [Paenibacillus sp. GSMTC-2017]